jgi:hypothetical protein
MLTVYFTNFGYASGQRFSSLKDALNYARRACFQAQIHNEYGHLLASWCPIAGTTFYGRGKAEMED